MNDHLLRLLPAEAVADVRRSPSDASTLAATSAILDDVRTRGADAVRDHAERLGDLAPGAPLTLGPAALRAALDSLDPSSRGVLERAADSIGSFARAQRRSLADIDVPIRGGRAGHRVVPVDRAGCYAPGGRAPLPSSVLMTAVTARIAGVAEVWVASPRPAPATLAAAAIAGVDGFLCVGGAQAVAAFAYGAGVPRSDIIVGPGNRWVTAAKGLVSNTVAIDMLAGPSEVLIIADDSAPPSLVAADLLAQAEHDEDAVPILVTTSAALPDAVDLQLRLQLAALQDATTAQRALRNGFCVLVPTIDAAVTLSDRLAPEHLEVMTRDASAVAARCRHYGGVFIGHSSAEVLGDYGVGPNHVLPTAGTARAASGLSVLTFLRVRTWMTIDAPAADLYRDVAAFARIEGLEAHARAAEARLAPG